MTLREDQAMTNASLADKLLPCPFCGGDKVMPVSSKCAWYDAEVAWAITCCTKDCHGGIYALGHDMFETVEQAAFAWNRRESNNEQA
jgi:hypothetical protein